MQVRHAAAHGEDDALPQAHLLLQLPITVNVIRGVCFFFLTVLQMNEAVETAARHKASHDTRIALQRCRDAEKFDDAKA